jgi:hypothetical protein
MRRGGLRHRRCRPWPRAPREAGTQLYLRLPAANTGGERSFFCPEADKK